MTGLLVGCWVGAAGATLSVTGTITEWSSCGPKRDMRGIGADCQGTGVCADGDGASSVPVPGVCQSQAAS